MSAVNTSMKARRLLQIKRYEKELQRLSRRFEQVADPMYVRELNNRVKAQEADAKAKVDKVNKLEID